MRGRFRVIAGVSVEMVAEGDQFLVLGDGIQLAHVQHSRDAGHPGWTCECGRYHCSQKDPMLGHVVQEHAAGVTAASAPPAYGKTLEAILTPLKLVGMHTDPTFDAAIERRYSRYAWPSW